MLNVSRTTLNAVMSSPNIYWFCHSCNDKKNVNHSTETSNKRRREDDGNTNQLATRKKFISGSNDSYLAAANSPHQNDRSNQGWNLEKVSLFQTFAKAFRWNASSTTWQGNWTLLGLYQNHSISSG